MKKIVLTKNGVAKNATDERVVTERKSAVLEGPGYEAEFSHTNGVMVSLRSGASEVKLKYVSSDGADVDPRLDESGEAAVYADVENGIDLKYELKGGKLKESFIVKERKQSYFFDFMAEIGDLEPSYDGESNSLELRREGKVVYRMLAPFMVDAAGRESRSCSYEVESRNGGALAIRLVADADWINDEERKFPVVIDPTFEIEPASSQLYHVYQGGRVDAYSEADEVFVGYKKEGGEIKYYSFSVEFDLTSLPIGDDGRNVFFEMPINYNIMDPNDEIVLLANGESIGSYAPSKLLGGGFLRVDLNGRLGEGNSLTLALHSASDDLLARSGSPYYHSLTLKDGVHKASLQVRDSDGAERAKVIVEPKEESIEYAEYDAGASGVTSVNVQTGRFKHRIRGLSVSNKSLTLSIDHVFDSRDSSEGVYGRGWGLSISQRLEKKTDGGVFAAYTDADGVTHSFAEKWFYKVGHRRVYVDRDDVTVSEDNELVVRGTGEKVNYSVASDDGYNYVSLASVTNYDARKRWNSLYIRYKNFKKPVLRGHNNYLQFVYHKDGNEYYVPNADVELVGDRFVTKVSGSGGGIVVVYLSKEKTAVNFEKGTATIYSGLNKEPKSVPLEKIAVYENADEGLYTTSEIENAEYEKLRAEHSLKEINELLSSRVSDEYSVLGRLEELYFQNDKAVQDGALNGTDGSYRAFYQLEAELISAYEQQLIAERNAYFLTRSFNAKIKEQKESVNDYVVEPSGRIVLFDGYGRMVGIANERDGEVVNRIKVVYGEDSRVDAVEADAERVVFKYGADGKLSSMKKSNGETVRFAYLNGFLSEVVGKGRKTMVAYDRGLQIYSDTNDEIIVHNDTANTIKVKKYVEPGTIDGHKEFNPSVERTLVQNDKYEYSPDFSSTRITDRMLGTVSTLVFGDSGKIVKREGSDGTFYANYFKSKLISSASIRNEARVLFPKESFAVNGGKLSLPSQGKTNYLTRSNAYCLKVDFGDIPATPAAWDSLSLSASYVKSGATYNFRQTFHVRPHSTIVLPFFLKGEATGLKACAEATEDGSAGIISTIADISIVETESGTLNEYDGEGRLWKTKTNEGKTTVLAFDGNLPTKVEVKDWNGKAVITEREYDEKGRLVYSVDSKGNCESRLYQKGGSAVERLSYNLKDASLVKKETKEYDEGSGAYLERGSIKDGEGRYPTKTSEFYVGTNVIRTLTDLDGSKTEYSVDPRTKKVVAFSRDNHGVKSSVSYVYNRDFLTSVKSDYMEVDYSYDGRRRLKSARIKGHPYDSVRNTYNDNVTIYGKGDKELPNGSVVKTMIDGVYEMRSEYDSDGRLINVQRGGKELSCSAQFSYGDSGDLLTYDATIDGDTEYTESAELSYDEGGRLIYKTKVVSEGKHHLEKDAFSLKYDDEGKVASAEIAVDGVAISAAEYFYNDDGLIEKETINKEFACLYEYDSLGRPSANEVRVCDKFSLARSISYLQQDGATLDFIAEEETNVLLPDGDAMAERRSYSYDVMGRIVSVKTDDKSVEYAYDSLGRLILERNESLGLEIKYSYDRLGNMLSRCSYDLESHALKDEEELTYSPDSRHLLSSYRGKAVISDQYGRIMSLNGTSFAWNCDGSLASATLPSGKKAEYAYDASGVRRLKKLPDAEVRYTTDGSRIISELRGGKRIDYVYGKDGLLGLSVAGEAYLYERNALGDVVRIYDYAGTIVGEYAYDAYGNCAVLIDEGGLASLNPFRYRGYYFDSETGLYYLNARYYDPRIGRFLSPDGLTYLDPSAAVGMNLYAYCQCDPVNKVDQTGHFSDVPEWLGWIFSAVLIAVGVALTATGAGGAIWGAIAGLMIGGGAGALIGGYTSKASGGSFLSGYIGGLATGAITGFFGSLGGALFKLALEATNLAVFGYLGASAVTSFTGGFFGNFLGEVLTSGFNSNFTFDDFDLGRTIKSSLLLGSLNIVAGMLSGLVSVIADIGNVAKVAKEASTVIACRVLAGGIASGAEAVYDFFGYIINLLLGDE